MNILLTSVLVPAAASGVRIHYQRMAELLRAEGHHVTVVTQDDLRPWVRRSIGAVRRLLGLVGGKLGQRMGIELGQVAELYCAIDRKQPYDLVNSQDTASGWAARLALRDKVPVVVTGHFHNHPAQEVINQLRLKPTGWAARFETRWFNFLLQRVRHFLSTSHYALRLAQPYLADNTHTGVAYNGVDLAAFAPSAAAKAAAPAGTDLRAKFPGRPIILNLGQLEARKNQRYLIAMAAELRKSHPNCVVALAGKGEDEAMLRALIAEQGLSDNVVLLGYHTQVAPLLHTADLYVHTATHENCPYALVEAMAAGCPAISLVAGGSPELLAATPEVSLSHATAPATMAAQIADLLDNDEARRDLQQRQFAYARVHFDRSAMVRDTLVFYRQAAGLPPVMGQDLAPESSAQLSVTAQPSL
jgi:glycosyltransferase involved in cell wall biosynthesis